MSFAYSKYGVFAAHALAREFCRRSDYFLSLWLAEPENDDFAYSAEALGSYEETEEWVDFLLEQDIESSTFAKGNDIRHLSPANPA